MDREILTDAIVVTPEEACEATVVVQDGWIIDILPHRAFPEGRSLAGHFLIPGLIDIHTDYLEREARPPRNSIPRVDCVDFPLSMSFHFMDVRAISSGITTVLGAAWITDPNQPSRWRYGDGLQLARDYQELRQHALARHYIHARWDPKFEPAEETLAQLLQLNDIGNLVYNDTTPGVRNQNIENQIRNYVFHRKISPEEARAHFNQLIEQGRTIDNRGAVHAALADRIPIGSHDDATEEEVNEAHHYGATLAEMPVTIKAARRAKALGMAVCMGAPNYLWGGSHCGNLSSLDAMSEGLVDIFCSDFHFPALLGAAVKMMGHGMAPADIFRLLTLNPARHLRLDHEIGSIQVGRKADLVAFVPRQDFGLVTHAWVDGQLRYHIACRTGGGNPAMSRIHENRGQTPSPPHRTNTTPHATIAELFEAQVERAPDQIALFHEDRAISYSELNARANRIAHHLSATLHVGPDVPVGLCVQRSDWMVAGMLGILKAGGAYVPIDPAYPPQRQAFMLADTACSVLLTDDPAASAGNSQVRICALTAVGHDMPASNPARCATGDNLAYIIYTSGSTGRPKGVMIEHRSIVNTLSWRQRFYGFGPGDVTLQLPSMSFDSSVEDIFGMLLSGGSLVILREDWRDNLNHLEPLLLRHRVTHMLVVPSLYRVLLAEMGASFSGLKAVTVAGEAVDRALVVMHYERLPHVTLVNEYGPTENAVCSTACVLNAEDQTVSIGKPIDNVEVYILDEDLHPVAPGETGQIGLAGRGLMRGYWQQPALTETRLIPHPLGKPGERLYLTGDLGRIDAEGRIEFLGRLDHQVKIRGFRVELGEVEQALASHEQVVQAVVIARDEAPVGKMLVAYIHGDPGLSAEALRSHLESLLPGYMVPAHFVFLESFPRLPNSKIDIRSLPPPAGLTHASDEEPHTPLQAELIHLLRALLGVPRIGLHDNFFYLGAHSLIVAQFAARISRTLRRPVTQREVFDHPTIAELARFLDDPNPRKAAPSPLRVVPRATRIPLTWQQEQVWFQQKLVPGSIAYNAQFTIRFKGILNLAALEASLSEIVCRHEILRTTFPEVDGQPVQVVHPPWPARVEVVDLSAFPAETREREVEDRVAQAIQQPFDYSQLPLIRWHLYRLGDNDHLFLTVEFHFVHDGWSVALFLSELKALYEAFAGGLPSPLRPVPLQLADYATWQRDPAHEPALVREIDHWERILRGHDFVLDLHPDRPRSAKPSFRGSLIRQDLPPALYRALRNFSHEHKVTLFTTLLAVFANLLSRYSGRDDLLIGTAVANRQGTDVEQMIGMTVNIIPLRIDLGGNPGFVDLLARTQQTVFEALKHQHVPIQRLVERMQPQRIPGMNPLFQVQFSFHDSPVPDLNFAGLHGELTIRHNGTSKADIDVICVPRAEQRLGRTEDVDDDRLTLLWQYSSELFEERTMAQMFDCFVTMLRDAIERPTVQIGHLDLLDAAGKERLLRGFNATRAACHEEQTLQGRFEEQARTTPDKQAVLCGDRGLTYGSLNARANQLAHFLRANHGVGPGDVVGLMAGRSERAIVGLLGILKAGAALVPLDPQYPERRLRFMAQDTGAKVIIAADGLPEHGAMEGVPVHDLRAIDARLQRHPTTDPGIRSAPDDPVYVIYTSGSTGTPKGVVAEHRGLLNLVRWYGKAIDLGEDDTLLMLSSLNFDVAQMDIFTTLLHGAALYLSEQIMGSYDAMAEVIVRHGCSIISATPSASYPLFEPGRMERLAGVKTFVFAGEPIHRERIRPWAESSHCNATIINGYGPTECTVLASAHTLDERDWQSTAPIPIGRPVANMRLYILDAQLQLVPTGIPGEIYIGGVGVTKGYLNRPDLTEKAFLPDPFHPGERMYRSGDLGKWLSDGTVVYLGRRDNQVKVRGLRIELGEIEACLETHDRLSRAVVLTKSEGGSPYLVAYLVMREAVSAVELREYLAQTLPKYMIPSRFVPVDSIPLTPTGKIDEASLRALEEVELALGVCYLPPRSTTEKRLAAIWQQVLQRKQIGVRDGFFVLGGHSLLATQVISRIRDVFALEIPLNSMFEHETLEALADHIDALQWAKASAARAEGLREDEELGEI